MDELLETVKKVFVLRMRSSRRHGCPDLFRTELIQADPIRPSALGRHPDDLGRSPYSSTTCMSAFISTPAAGMLTLVAKTCSGLKVRAISVRTFAAL